MWEEMQSLKLKYETAFTWGSRENADDLSQLFIIALNLFCFPAQVPDR